ncbi:ABC transporter permease subunit [Candidatus Aerophobetes bacterium]|nr:ABC transporter permease subunit [Candidatus Aerophobetes bacterium]
MKNFSALFKKEIKSYFVSPIAYVLICVFLVICGYFFYRDLLYFSFLSLQAGYDSSLQSSVNINELILRPLFSNMSFILLFLVPLLTMRIFSEEKKLGTLELLLSYPVRDVEVIMGKFAASLVVLLVALGITSIFPIILFILGEPEAGPIICGYLGLILMSVAFIFVGMLFSSLTENQIIAATATFGALLLFWAIGWSSAFAPGVLGKLLAQLSAFNHFSSFARGVINTSDLTFYINLSLFFLFLTAKSLQARAWKG